MWELFGLIFLRADDGIRDLTVTGVHTCTFFISSRRRHTRFDCDWSSDVCSSDLVDHQIGLMTGVRDYPIALLKHNVVALAKAAKALKLPMVVTTTARDSMWGPTIPELVEALPGLEIIDRSSVNAYDDARVARAIEATGRKKLIFAGLSLEVCAAFPAMTAVSRGLDAYVAVDACGTFSETKHQVGLLRMVQAGVVVSDYTTLMVEILKDNARPEAGAVYGAMDMDWAKLVGQISAEYAKK